MSRTRLDAEEKIGCAFIVWWIFCMLFGLGSTGVIIYVAWHFASKFW